MRQLQLVPALLLAAATSGLAQGGVEQSLRRLEDEWARAVVRRDPAPLRRLLSEDFIATDGRGQLHDKAQLIAALEDPSDTVASAVDERSGERRVGEEWRSRWSAYHLKKKK